MAYSRISNSSPKAVAARREWNEANYDRLTITVRKGKKAAIQRAAETSGTSVNAWIGQAIEEKLQNESAEG